jgi:hypothetical protein
MTRASPMPGDVRPDALLTLAAVLLVGFVAGRLVSPSMYVATALVAVLVWRGTRERATDDSRGDDLAFLPNDLRTRASEALARCGDGDARRLLLVVITQARPLFTRNRTQLDERAERETRENVSSLVDACCVTAELLADLDRAIVAAPQGSDASARAPQLRQRLADHLGGAATTLEELYLAGIEHETDALSRVSQLTTAIHDDAAARRAATEEIQRVLKP